MRTRLAVTAFLLLASLGVPGVPGTARTTPAAEAAAGGAVWLPTLQATQGFDKLSAFRDGTYYAQYLDSYARSTDFGKTWLTMPRPPGQGLGSPGIRFATPKVGWSVAGGNDPADAASDPARYAEQIRRCGDISPLNRTTDGGTTWKYVCIPRTGITSDPKFGVGSAPLAVHANGRSLLLTGQEHPLRQADPPACGEEQTVVYTSHDAGAKWVRAALPRGWSGGYRQQILDTSTVAHLAYHFDPDVAACSSSKTGLFVSRDGGRSFRKAKVCDTGAPCTSFLMLTRSRFLLGRADGSTLVSDNGGKTWRSGQKLSDGRWETASNGNLQNAFWVQGFAFADARHGYASTRGNGTWRTVDGGRSWTQERSHECEFYVPGIGEIAAASPAHAVTGGPHFISSRAETPAPPAGCARPQPQQSLLDAAAPVASFTAGPAAYTLRLDGALTRTR